jgi:hypothetical protein
MNKQQTVKPKYYDDKVTKLRIKKETMENGLITKADRAVATKNRRDSWKKQS